MWPGLWRAALAVSGSRERAEDAVQDAMERGFRDLQRFESTAELFAWLRQVSVNRAIDLSRSEHIRSRYESASAPQAFDVARPDDYSWDAQDPDLLAACRRLTAQMRHVLLLRYWADMELGEIADALGVPVGTVKSRMSRALRLLREDLQEASR